MAKKPIALDGLLNTSAHPIETGIPQRGAGEQSAPKPPPPKRQGEKRLTLALDGETYRRLRLYAAQTDQTHQSILEVALAQYLQSKDA